MLKFFMVNCLVLASVLSCSSSVNTSVMSSYNLVKPTQADVTALYFAKNSESNVLLYKFLYLMPKGGDIHSHFVGTAMAEDLIHNGKGHSICLNPTNYMATIDKNDCALPLDSIQSGSKLESLVIDSWSMRDFKSNKVDSGSKHFFLAFAKTSTISHSNYGNILAEVTNRAAAQNELYLELMLTPDGYAGAELGKKINWESDLDTVYTRIIASNQIPRILKAINVNINSQEKIADIARKCNTASAQIGCNIKVRYLYQVGRNYSPNIVFTEMVLAFEAAKHNVKIVGINLIQEEAAPISMRDYTLHMQMVKFLKHKYPSVHVSLHAGELVPAIASESGLSFHITSAVELASAERIGHGVDITNETNNLKLLHTMSKQHTLVEINLTSNYAILGLRLEDHPLPLYLKYHVPVTLSTDDEGILRTNLTNEYFIAAQQFHLDYITLKNMSRNALQYSFLDGNSLWDDYDFKSIHSNCKSDYFKMGNLILSDSCKIFLQSSSKASLQWELERKFYEFEQYIANQNS